MKTKAKDVLRSCRRFLRAGEAVSALEYAILVGVIVAGIAAALVVFSGNIRTAVTGIGTGVAGVSPAPIPSLVTPTGP